MNRKSIAIVGAGLAGMACGRLLHEQNDITLYERNDYAGGFGHTLRVEEAGHAVPIDRGFAAFNPAASPEFVNLLRQLGIQTQPVSLSLGVQHLSAGVEFQAPGLARWLSRRGNIVKMDFWKLLFEIQRFNNDASRMLDDYSYEAYTLLAYAEEKRFSPDVLHLYVIPLVSLLVSIPAREIMEAPAVMVMRLLQAHGFLSLSAWPAWQTINGGNRILSEKLTAPFHPQVRLNTPVKRVTRRPGAVQVIDTKGDARSYDHAILACHADEALALLTDPDPQERAALAAFRYQRHTATLHTDTTVMPGRRAAWASWNYRAEVDRQGRPALSLIYWMNALQGISQDVDYFVSVDDPGNLIPVRVVERWEFARPILTMETTTAQKKLKTLNIHGLVSFCGDYFGYGLPEDALRSAQELCKMKTQEVL